MKKKYAKFLVLNLGFLISSFLVAEPSFAPNTLIWPVESQENDYISSQHTEEPYFPDYSQKEKSAPNNIRENAPQKERQPGPAALSASGKQTLLFSVEHDNDSSFSPSKGMGEKSKPQGQSGAVPPGSGPYESPKRFTIDASPVGQKPPQTRPAPISAPANSAPVINSEAFSEPLFVPMDSEPSPTRKMIADLGEPAAAPKNIESPAEIFSQSPQTQMNSYSAQPKQVPPATDASPAGKRPDYLSQAAPQNAGPGAKTPGSILINFNNVDIIEYIRFISRITNKNFVFDERDLQFNITIVSEEATTVENIMMALLQELRIHDLEMIEQGNNIIIHKNPRVNAISKVVSDDMPDSLPAGAEIITQVFRLNTLDPAKAAAIIRPLMSEHALVETLYEPSQLIITDLVGNVTQIAKLIKSLDSPNGGLVIGQYVARTTEINTLLPLTQQIMQPISQDQPLILVPYENANSIFIVSSPFLVERTISILQHLDQEKGKTRIIDLAQLKFEQGATGGAQGPGYPGGEGAPGQPGQKAPGVTMPSYPGYQPLQPWEYGIPEGAPEEKRTEAGAPGWEYGPGATKVEKPQTLELVPLFVPVERQKTQAEIDALKELDELRRLEGGRAVGVTRFRVQSTEKLSPRVEVYDEFVPKPIEHSRFYLHKLQYRKGDVVLAQVQKIASSMRDAKGNEELLATIDTMQFLEDSKTLVITGRPEYLEKVKSLIEQVDIPLRQVFIEMLILTTTVDESLNFGVNWGNRFGGGHQAGSQGWLAGPSTLQGSLDTTQVTGLGDAVPNGGVVPFNEALLPDPSNLAKATGFNLGILGQHIIHKGMGIEFSSIGALISALHDRNRTDIILSPRIITEDGVPAQIFVGINTPFKTQSVSNDQGSIVTNNFEFRDVGTSLQVTPHLGNSDIVTLEIIQEVSSVQGNVTTSGNSNQALGPTTNKSNTKATIHVPDGYFVILSGMMQDEVQRNRSQVPCLGGIPLAGAAFSFKQTVDNKRNLMVFIRPQIVDTDEQVQNITRHQQDIWKFDNTIKKSWLFETEQALEFLNVSPTQNNQDYDFQPEYYNFQH